MRLRSSADTPLPSIPREFRLIATPSSGQRPVPRPIGQAVVMRGLPQPVRSAPLPLVVLDGFLLLDIVPPPFSGQVKGSALSPKVVHTIEEEEGLEELVCICG